MMAISSTWNSSTVSAKIPNTFIGLSPLSLTYRQDEYFVLSFSASWDQGDGQYGERPL